MRSSLCLLVSLCLTLLHAADGRSLKTSPANWMSLSESEIEDEMVNDAIGREDLVDASGVQLQELESQLQNDEPSEETDPTSKSDPDAGDTPGGMENIEEQEEPEQATETKAKAKDGAKAKGTVPLDLKQPEMKPHEAVEPKTTEPKTANPKPKANEFAGPTPATETGIDNPPEVPAVPANSPLPTIEKEEPVDKNIAEATKKTSKTSNKIQINVNAQSYLPDDADLEGKINKRNKLLLKKKNAVMKQQSRQLFTAQQRRDARITRKLRQRKKDGKKHFQMQQQQQLTRRNQGRKKVDTSKVKRPLGFKPSSSRTGNGQQEQLNLLESEFFKTL